MSRHSRFAGEAEEDMARARQRAEEGQRQYDEENDRDYQRWRAKHSVPEPGFFDQKGNWDFSPLLEESGRISGYKVKLDGRYVALVIPRNKDIVVLMTDAESGGVRAQYRHQTVDAQNVIDAFMAKQLKEGP